jgi:hypothetical protein
VRFLFVCCEITKLRMKFSTGLCSHRVGSDLLGKKRLLL